MWICKVRKEHFCINLLIHVIFISHKQLFFCYLNLVWLMTYISSTVLSHTRKGPCSFYLKFYYLLCSYSSCLPFIGKQGNNILLKELHNHLYNQEKLICRTILPIHNLPESDSWKYILCFIWEYSFLLQWIQAEKQSNGSSHFFLNLGPVVCSTCFYCLSSPKGLIGLL